MFVRRAFACVSLVAVVVSASGCSKSEPERAPEPEKTAEAVPLSPMAPPLDPNGNMALPPGHPPIGAQGGDASMAFAPPSDVQGPDIAWDVPAAWKTLPNPNSMRRATYEIPKAPGDADGSEMTVSTAGGGVDANIARWASQFGDAKPVTQTKTVGALKITTVEIKGTFGGGAMMPGMAGGPSKDKQMLLGAIVEQGDREHFFKLTGPEKSITAAKKDFDKLVASIHAKP